MPDAKGTPCAAAAAGTTGAGPFKWWGDDPLFHGCNNAAAAGLPNGSVAVWCYSVANKSTRACEYQVFVADRCASCPTSCE